MSLTAERLQAKKSGAQELALRLYALTDPAADRSTNKALLALSVADMALLASISSPADASPQLLDLGSVDLAAAEVLRVAENRCSSAAFTLLTSSWPLGQLHAHLESFTNVTLPGPLGMLLAIWDPAILATLVGQADDDTLHVAGPVLSEPQRNALLAPVTAWWYLDRGLKWHCIEGLATVVADVESQRRAVLPLTLDQAQEDALVEASVPDQVLYHLDTNHPTLMDESALPRQRRYAFARVVIKSARQLGLQGMRDLVNFLALSLIYRQRLTSDPQILTLLDQVQRKELTLDEAMPLMPE